MQVNEVLHGFKLFRKRHIEEVESEAFEFEHEKSGARVLFLANQDDNKVFSIAFRTPPKDDTGVAHIVEHSTLCGSRKFPLKEPFVELVKGSLNTFLNAMTYPDKTVYPIASRNDKDFRNLMDVYLDAVFYPEMRNRKEILMQEGWHYEIDSPEAPLRYSGVVYNEMKGALSSPDDILQEETAKALYPDTTYSKESGGNPEAIPSLTQEMFLDFHGKYYHPSNSYIYLYGDMDMDSTLEFLDTEYLSNFDRIEVDSAIGIQQPYNGLKKFEKEYPVGAEESTAEKTFLSFNTIIEEPKNKLLAAVVGILNNALFNSQAAPLRKALMDAGIGKDVSAYLENALMQPFYSITVNGSEPEKAELFLNVLQENIKKILAEGIDRTLLEAAINSTEFKIREADFGSYPKGLIYNLNSLTHWIYDGDPLEPLYYEELLKQLREGLDNGLYEKILKEHILENPHQVLMVLKPSTTMAAEREAALEKKLAEKKATLSDEDIANIISETAALKERQQSPETPEALASIPILSLDDIKKKTDELPLEEREINGVKVLYSDLPTNGIAYIKLFFDANVIPQKLLPYAFLLVDMLGQLDTEKHSYEDLTKRVDLYTGGLSTDLLTYADNKNHQIFYPKFTLEGKALAARIPELISIMEEILTGTVFTNKKRVKELLLQLKTNEEMDILRVPNRYLAARMASYVSKNGLYDEQGELTYYWFVRELADMDFDEAYEKICTAFNELLPKMANRKNMVISVGLREKYYGDFEKAAEGLIEALPNKDVPAEEYSLVPTARNEGLMTSSQVQYVGKGANFRNLGYSYTGSMKVLETILRYDYFWTKIRVQGGAYGALTIFGRTGNMLFASYRDPNLKETLDVLNGTGEFIRNFDASDREMEKYIIGTFSNVDMPLTPRTKAKLAADFWFSGVTYADRQKIRDEVLSTRQQDIRNLADCVDACMKADNICVFGGETKLKENEDCFKTLVKVVE